MDNKLLIICALLLGFTLWRNFGVKPIGGIVLNSPFGSNEKSNEQKELIKKIQSIGRAPKDGDILITSFGKNIFTNGAWVKYAEVWQ